MCRRVEEVLREKLLALADLQKVDVDIASLKKTAEAHPREIAELEKQLAAAQAAVDAEKQKLGDLDTQRSNMEQTLTDDKDKVRKWEGRLSDQRTTREYSALAREIDIAKKGQVTMGEELVELAKMSAIQRETVKSRDAEFQTKASELTSRINELKTKLADVEAQVKTLEDKRGDVAKAVDSNLLRQYDNIRKKRMPALAAVRAPGTCSGCRMSIPAQRFNLLVASRGTDVCPSCQRMIYAAEVLDASPK